MYFKKMAKSNGGKTWRRSLLLVYTVGVAYLFFSFWHIHAGKCRTSYRLIAYIHTQAKIENMRLPPLVLVTAQHMRSISKILFNRRYIHTDAGRAHLNRLPPTSTLPPTTWRIKKNNIDRKMESTSTPFFLPVMIISHTHRHGLI